MMKWLLLAMLIGIADPILLYHIWKATNGWVVFALLIPLPMVISRISAMRRLSEPDFGAMLLTIAARLLVWYPGPISKALAIAMLFPPLQRLIQKWAAARLRSAVDAGSVSVSGGTGGFSFHGGHPGATGGPAALKQAEGRVIEPSEPTGSGCELPEDISSEP